MGIQTFSDVATGIRTKLLTSTDIAAIVSQDQWGGIHKGQPDATAGFPLVRMQWQADSDDIVTLGDTVYQLFYISVIGVSRDSEEADQLTKLVFAELNRQTLVIGNPDVFGTAIRMSGIWYQEGEGNTYTHSGGIYRIGVRANG